MQLSIQQSDSLGNLLFRLFLRASRRTALLVGTDVLVELGNLVRVLTRRWNFNRASPVEVEVTQSKCQLLNLKAVETRIILGHKEVSWQHTALVGAGRGQVEVKTAAGGSLLLGD